ncbi:MAG: hypothetical protein MJ231_01375 [bacterium]|nr:hypothetical protein [bacterium]
MGLINSINVVGKNYKKYDVWEQAQADERAKKEWLAKKTNITPKQEEDVRHKAETIIRATEIMDAKSENNCENMEQATEMLAAIPATGIMFAEMPLISFIDKKMTSKLKAQIKVVEEDLLKTDLSADAKMVLENKIKTLNGKLKKATTKASKIGTLATILTAFFVSSFFIVWGNSKQKEASRIGRFQAKQNELKDISNFVNYTPEQIEEAHKIAKTLPNEKKEKNNLASSIREFKEMEQNKREYKAWLNQRDPKEIENLKNRELTAEQIKKGNEEKEIIVDTVKEINIKAEEYSENLENAYDTLKSLTWLLVIPVGILTNKILKLFKASRKVTAAVSIALPTILPLIIGFKGTVDQKEASRVGRYHARKDLLKNPTRLLAFTDEQMESAKDIKAPVQKSGFFNKLGQSFKFLKTYGKDKREYKEYKKTIELENKKLQKAFKQIEISDKQKVEAENLQKNVYRAFDEVDEMSQKYSEDIEAGCEIAKEGLSTAWSLATIFGSAAAILGITKGKIRLIKPTNKLVNFIFDKNSSLRKTFNELTKTVTSKGKETSSEFQRAIIKKNMTKYLEKPENAEIKNSVQNLVKEIGKVSGEVIAETPNIENAEMEKVIKRVLDTHMKQTKVAKWGRNLLTDIGKILTRKHSEKIFGKELSKEELRDLKLDFSYKNYKTIINTGIVGAVPIFGIIAGIPYAINAMFTNIQKKAGKIGVMKAMDNIDDPRVFAPET